MSNIDNLKNENLKPNFSDLLKRLNKLWLGSLTRQGLETISNDIAILENQVLEIAETHTMFNQTERLIRARDDLNTTYKALFYGDIDINEASNSLAHILNELDKILFGKPYFTRETCRDCGSEKLSWNFETLEFTCSECGLINDHVKLGVNQL